MLASPVTVVDESTNARRVFSMLEGSGPFRRVTEVDPGHLAEKVVLEDTDDGSVERVFFVSGAPTPPEPEFSPESGPLFAAFTGSPTTAQKELYDGLIRSLVDFNLWDSIPKLIIPGNLHDATDGLRDWKTGNLIASLAGLPEPTWTAGLGFLTDGVQNEVLSGINANEIPQNAGGMFQWNVSTNAPAGSQSGWFDGTDGTVINPNDANGRVATRINQELQSTTANGTSDGSEGFTHINRSGESATEVYQNGVAKTNTGNPNQISVTPNDAILRFGQPNAAVFTITELSIFGITDVSFTAQMAEDLFSIFQAFELSK